jgi:hypothetical protein
MRPKVSPVTDGRAESGTLRPLNLHPQHVNIGTEGLATSELVPSTLRQSAPSITRPVRTTQLALSRG